MENRYVDTEEISRLIKRASKEVALFVRLGRKNITGQFHLVSQLYQTTVINAFTKYNFNE